MISAWLDADPGSDLDSATLFLPSDRRRQLVAFAALCGELFDGAEGSDRDLAALGSGAEPMGPAARALAAAVPRAAIPLAPLQRLQQASIVWRAGGRAASWEDWQARQLRLAEPIGEALAALLGAHRPASTRRLAGLALAVVAAGLALDPASAARWLPEEDLRRHDRAGDDRPGSRPGNGTRELQATMCERARRLFFQAEAADPGPERSLLFPAEVYARLAYERLERIEAAASPLLSRRRKIWIAFSAWLKYRILG